MGEKIGLRFSEEMSGYLGEGIEDFAEGEKAGKEKKHKITFDIRISIADVARFCSLSGRKAVFAGAVSFPPLGRALPVRNGEFSLFLPDRETGKRRMTYSFSFTGKDGEDYFLAGYKVLDHEPRHFDLPRDITTLYTRLYRGDSPQAPLYGAGILRFHLPTLPFMLTSFRVTGTRSVSEKLKTITRFYSFCYGEVRDTYLRGMSPIYHSAYENLVLNGFLRKNGGGENPFFFFSGVHSKDFPWGDGEVFSDIALAIREGEDGWRKFVLTDRVIAGLSLDVKAGSYRYKGPIFEIIQGHQVFKSELDGPETCGRLRRIEAEINLRFESRPLKTVRLPFSSLQSLPLLPRKLREEIKDWLPHFRTLGLHLTPHRIRILEGQIDLVAGASRDRYQVVQEATGGEGEVSTLQSVRWPKIYYNYFCAPAPSGEECRVRIETDVLRGNRKDWAVDRVQEKMGKMIRFAASLDLQMGEKGIRRLPGKKKRWERAGEPILEINNDHFPTAVFQRRIVPLKDAAGREFLALEENMDPLNLGSIRSERVVKAAAIRGPDRFANLDGVLEETGFFGKLNEACLRTGKKKEDLAIIVKPNFMFMYSTKDRSTFTDPELIEHLIGRMYERGYRNLACAEARSTYGTFFKNREVKTVAAHIGLSGKNYRIIDLSEDLEEFPFSGKLGDHFVNREWKNADFRIVFAKNKTHSYAFYTLAIKCVFGALPMENKFREYHHKRDIYSTTIEFMKRFPIHFAFIDAHISADGPFGIFADKKPNPTETIIGSESPIAADWIGASKMGLDPLVSDYMKSAVEAFGKPRIELIGDRSLYPAWVNVTDALPLFAFGVLDRNYYFGNLFYAVFAYMEDFFPYKDPRLGVRLARVLAGPLKSLFFQKIKKGDLDPEANKGLYEQLSRSGEEE